jgi:hypothetical protein
MADDTGKDDTETGGDDTEDEEKEPYEAPDEETWSATNKRVTDLNAEAKKWRLRAQGKDPKWKAPVVAPAKDDDNGAPAATGAKPVDVEKVRREAEDATLAKAKPGLVRAAARDALRDAGLIVPTAKDKADGALARAVRLLDLAEIDVDPEDGTVSGVEEQVKAVKREYPELFAKKGARTIDAGAGGGGNGDVKPANTSANRLAALINRG